MYKIGDFVVYKRDVCKIVNIKNEKGINYYILVPIDDDTLKITVDVNNNFIRSIKTKEESESLIKDILNIDVINTDDKNLENEYKKLLSSGSLEDLVKIIKTTYLRNKERMDNHKKIGEKDDNYFKKAEKLLYNELSISLNMSYEDTKNYIINKVNNLIK